MQIILSLLNKLILTCILLGCFIFAACEPKLTDELVFKIVLPEEQKDLNLKKDIEQTLSVITERLDNYGLLYNKNQLKQVDSAKHIYSIMLPKIENKKSLEYLVISAGNLEFWEVYENKELPLLHAYISENDFLGQHLISSDQMGNTSFLGMAQPSDTSLIINLLDSISRNTLLSNQIKYAWGSKAEDANNNLFALYALKKTRLRKGPTMNGESIVEVSAQPSEHSPSVWIVNLRMNTHGAKQWAILTRTNIGKALAITIDNRVYSAPTVHQPIIGGSSSITGNFTKEEAKEMALILSAGTIPLKVEIIEFASKK